MVACINSTAKPVLSFQHQEGIGSAVYLVGSPHLDSHDEGGIRAEDGDSFRVED